MFNKAVYLIVDGASFNGYTVRGLGLAKTAKVVWTTQNLLTSGADDKDVFYTMPLACRKNIGREVQLHRRGRLPAGRQARLGRRDVQGPGGR